MDNKMEFLLTIKRRIGSKEYLLSRHAQMERLEEDIDVQDIETAHIPHVAPQQSANFHFCRTLRLLGAFQFFVRSSLPLHLRPQ